MTGLVNGALYPEREFVILSYEQHALLHMVLMRYPEPTPILSIDVDLVALLENKFVRQVPGGYLPTEAGVHHMSGRRRKQRW